MFYNISKSHGLQGRGSALALFNWGVYMGFGLSIALVSVNNAIGWRYVYVIAGSPGILLAALVVFTVKEPITAKLPVKGLLRDYFFLEY